MKKNILIIILLVVAILIAICFFIRTNHTSSIFNVINNEDGSIAINAQKAGKNASGIGYITIEEGQKLEVRSNLNDNSSIKIEVLPKNIDATTKVLMEEIFTAIDAREFELPSGDYTIRITVEKNATGSMDIKAK